MFCLIKWRQWVDQTQVRGPFSPDDLDSMHNHGRMDRGLVSHYENFMRTLQQYQETEGTKGILYVHDDALVNFPRVFPKRDSHRSTCAGKF
jgi:hypothetical protein